MSRDSLGWTFYLSVVRIVRREFMAADGSPAQQGTAMAADHKVLFQKFDCESEAEGPSLRRRPKVKVLGVTSVGNE